MPLELNFHVASPLAAAGRMSTLSEAAAKTAPDTGVLTWEMPPLVLLPPPLPLTSARSKRSITSVSMARTTVCALPPR